MATPSQKPDEQPGVPLNLRIAPPLKKRFKVWCAEHEVEMTAAVTHWITLALAGKLPPPADAKARKQR